MEFVQTKKVVEKRDPGGFFLKNDFYVKFVLKNSQKRDKMGGGEFWSF